jgi:hypothetical protein
LFFDVKAFPEALDTTGGVKNALLPGKEWMAFRANVNLQKRFRTHCFKGIAAGATYRGFHKVWMDSLFHLFSQITNDGSVVWRAWIVPDRRTPPIILL